MPKTPETVAAVDLGSNSFHMVVAGLRNDNLLVIDRLREMVRLGAGLDAKRCLTPEAQVRALDCLERFGQRVREMAPGSVRAVGTNTLRVAGNAQQFLNRAEHALGHPIEIISGAEEARLIYQGVARSLAADGKRRLVMDIGGGSTEFIIGVDHTPLHKESLHMGCVSNSLKHFPGGKITAKRFKKAVIAAQQELEPIQMAFRKGHWTEAVGASGSLRTIQKTIVTSGWSKGGITAAGLEHLVEAILAAGDIAKLATLPELNAERAPVFPGGLAIIYATFKNLDIDVMHVSDGALREGLLYDLIGRLKDDDIRSRTVTAIAARYHVDHDHAGRVRETVRTLAEPALPGSGDDRETVGRWLDWACELHEIGLDIAHSQYHKHSAYIIENADLPGFSQQDQKLLATLVRAHRRKFPTKLFKDLAPPWNITAPKLAMLLRLGILLNRNRHPVQFPSIDIQMTESTTQLQFPKGWLADHPLTAADLEQEAAYLRAAGMELHCV